MDVNLQPDYESRERLLQMGNFNNELEVSNPEKIQLISLIRRISYNIGKCPQITFHLHIQTWFGKRQKNFFQNVLDLWFSSERLSMHFSVYSPGNDVLLLFQMVT